MGWFTSLTTTAYRYYTYFFRDALLGKGIQIEMDFNNPKEAIDMNFNNPVGTITLDFPDTGKA